MRAPLILASFQPSRLNLNSFIFLFRSCAFATLFSVVSVGYAQENTPLPAQSARPPMRSLVDQLSPQERMELRKQLRQHAREHGSTQQVPNQGASPMPSQAAQQSNPNVVLPRILPSASPNPAQNSPTSTNPPIAGNPRDTDRLSGIERQQLRAQLREAKMREEQERQDREAKQNQRAKGSNSGGGKPNPPPAK
jgi:uncharacterized membrane protein